MTLPDRKGLSRPTGKPIHYPTFHVKTNFRNILLGLATTASLISTASAMATSNGDLLIGFYQLDENNNVGPSTYVFNLGPASLIRENTKNNVLVSAVNPAITNANIGADLAEAFGADWAESGTVYWGVVGGLNQTTSGIVGGDTEGTSYISRAVSKFAAEGSTTVQPSISGAIRPDLRNAIEPFLLAVNGVGTPGTNPGGAIIEATLRSGFDFFLPPASAGLQFGVTQEIRQSFGAGILTGSTNLEGALDLWRMIGGTSTAQVNASGADLTSGLAPAAVILGKGQFCGTITLDTEGNLRIGGTAATPPGGNFESWALENNITGGTEGDSDNDGVTNIVEYALQTNLIGSDGSLGSFSSGLLSFTKRDVAVTNNDVIYAIEESDDLGLTDPWQAVVPTSDTPTTLSYQIPAGSARKFARLKIATAP